MSSSYKTSISRRGGGGGSRRYTSGTNASISSSSHRFTQRGDRTSRVEPRAWVTVPVPDVKGGIEFRPRGFNDENTSVGSTAWDIKSRYMMATRSGPTECPDHLMAKHKGFQKELETFPSPYSLYYFDETAPNNLLLANDLKLKKASKPDYQRIPTKNDKNGTTSKDAMAYDVRKLFFDVDDIRVPEDGTGLKLLPSYTVSYKNYPAICYDVIAPKSYLEFFRVRNRPGMFS